MKDIDEFIVVDEVLFVVNDFVVDDVVDDDVVDDDFGVFYVECMCVVLC